MHLLEYIFPKQCIVCSRIGQDICNSCIKRLPRAIPTCCICNKLSNGYLTHTRCIKIPIYHYKGWYVTKEIESKLSKRRKENIYSTYEYLLKRIILDLGIQEVVSNSKIYPIYTNQKEFNHLNNYLSKRIGDTNRKKRDILYISAYETDIHDVIQSTKMLYKKNPFNIYFLTLLTYSSSVTTSACGKISSLTSSNSSTSISEPKS